MSEQNVFNKQSLMTQAEDAALMLIIYICI